MWLDKYALADGRRIPAHVAASEFAKMLAERDDVTRVLQDTFGDPAEVTIKRGGDGKPVIEIEVDVEHE